MPVYFTTGDVTLTRCEAIAHGVNARGVMGAGIAKTLAQLYPEMERQYNYECRKRFLTAGGVQVWEASSPKIINLCTQDAFDGARLEYVEEAFVSLRQLIDYGTLNVRSIAMPKIAAGLGGLSWEHIVPIIVKNLNDLPITVQVYHKYVKGLRSKELG